MIHFKISKQSLKMKW